MGLNILIQKLDGTYHPDWDDSKHSGDREVAILFGRAIPTENEPGYDPWMRGDAAMFRPTDPGDLDRAEWPAENPDRWAHLRRILREEPDYWIYLSI